MTKLVVMAVMLRLEETGWFAPLGLDTPIDRLLTSAQIKSLTVGDDAAHPHCPGATYLLNRATRNFEFTKYSCPDLSQVTLRNLMLSNHGMYDFVNEVLLPDGSDPIGNSWYYDYYKSLGQKLTPHPDVATGFGQLAAYGLKRNKQAAIGGNVFHRDLEPSFGNTGFQLVGVILEQRTGKTLDQLIKTWVTQPLGIEDMSLYLRADSRSGIANGYDMYVGDPPFGDFYPLDEFHGYWALNTLSFGRGLPANINFAGGAGSLVATPRSYAVFLRALVEGGLLGARAQQELNSSFISISDFDSGDPFHFANGFGLLRRQFRGVPGTADFDTIEHFGDLSGLACLNAEVRRPDQRFAPIAAAMCLNVANGVYPDRYVFWNNLVDKVMGVNIP
jgi:hypothetical protein